MRVRRHFIGVSSLVLVALLATACAPGMFPRHLGIRPPEPTPQGPTTAEEAARPTACQEYAEYSKYAQELQEAYHARASQNRAWIYVAGIVGLGAIAATAGLAAAGAAALGTIALINISGGFAAGTFATIDNSTLADVYTISTTAIDSARDEAARLLPPAAYSDHRACKEALDLLRGKVSEARTNLEEARTNSAKAAVMRAAAQQEGLRKQIEALGLAFDVSEPTRAIAPGESLLLTVSGGKPEYGARTIDSALEIVKQPTKANKNVAEIKAKAGASGPYEVVFYDNGGRTKSRTITVKAGGGALPTKDLSVVPLERPILASEKDRAVLFLVTGGTPPYTVGSVDTGSQAAIALEPASGTKLVGDRPIVKVVLAAPGTAGARHGATVKDDAGKTAAFAIDIAPALALVGVPSDRKLTLTQGTSLVVAIVGGVPRAGRYEVVAPRLPPGAITPAAAPGAFDIKTAGVPGGDYDVSFRDDVGQHILLSLTVKAPPPVMPVVGVDLIRRTQQALKDKGCDPIEIDGILGPHTGAALRCFQKKASLAESGAIDPETLKALGLS